MFFFFVCGEHTFRKEVSGYEGMVCQCHHCGNMAAHVQKSNPWFTFCWIVWLLPPSLSSQSANNNCSLWFPCLSPVTPMSHAESATSTSLWRTVQTSRPWQMVEHRLNSITALLRVHLKDNNLCATVKMILCELPIQKSSTYAGKFTILLHTFRHWLFWFLLFFKEAIQPGV